MLNLKRHLIVDCGSDKCVGCSTCEYVCSLKKEGTFNPTKSRIRAIRINPFVNIAITCRKCEDAPCVIACPKEGALVQRQWDGLIVVNEEECNGCGWCVEACAFGAIALHPEGRVAMVCDLCGGEPECVKWCPEEALQLISKDVLPQKARIKIVKKLGSNKKMREVTYAGVPRSKISWYPIIDYEKCATCDRCSEEFECVKFCAHGVFKTVEEQEKSKPIVVKPNACVVFCTSCAKACPTDAITFPSKKEVRDIIAKWQDGEE